MSKEFVRKLLLSMLAELDRPTTSESAPLDETPVKVTVLPDPNAGTGSAISDAGQSQPGHPAHPPVATATEAAPVEPVMNERGPRAVERSLNPS